MTELESAPWLAVDLGEETYVTHVVMTTGLHRCSERYPLLFYFK